MNKIITPTEKEITERLCSPFYCGIFKSVIGKYETIISEKTWILAQKNLVKELGEEKYFRTLLKVLKSDIQNISQNFK